ncbi:AbrB/MazE/SpoVT family DNA-binding domain-containing protein [Candidatus Woesearchaeota archaeon]|nr:AbrB/MazE/SpoVT family DNA-binding domain-containing protein [Candidatus Woesearchaeota archaeon]
MNDMNKRIRTVIVNERGQIVIPEEVRKDFEISKGSTLVLIERSKELLLKKESDVLESIQEEDKFWRSLSRESLKRAWSKEDDIWDKAYKEGKA